MITPGDSDPEIKTSREVDYTPDELERFKERLVQINKVNFDLTDDEALVYTEEDIHSIQELELEFQNT